MKFVLQQQNDNFTPKPSHKQQVSNQQLSGFKKGIKREVTSFPTLKDDSYFDSFSRSLCITAKSHDCDEVLDPDYTPSTEDKELFENKQVFVCSVFHTHSLTDMGKTIVKKHRHSTDAQAVWKDNQEHMKSSLKGASEKRRLTQYVTNTVLDDNLRVQQSNLYSISMNNLGN